MICAVRVCGGGVGDGAPGDGVLRVIFCATENDIPNQVTGRRNVAPA